MRQLVHYYKDFNTFQKWCKGHKVKNSNKLIIEINYPSDDRERLEAILARLNENFPDAIISGMQSFASFLDHQISDLNEDPILSIIELEHSKVSSLVLDLSKNYTENDCKNEYKADKNEIQKYLQSDTQAIEILSSFNTCQTSFFINSLGEDFRHLKIFGGGATSKSHQDSKSFVFHGNNIYQEAIILIFWHGENLSVELYQAFDWKPISKKKKITKTDGSTILTMADSPALDIYRKYFPNIENERSVFLQVPLYITKENISYTVHILDIDLKTQSIITAQQLNRGNVVQLSIGNYNSMMNRIQEIYKFLSETPAEALWIGTCISYEYGFRIPIKHYISNIKSNNHIFGYITSQEYFNQENHPHTYHNHTFILAAISENANKHIDLVEYKDTNITPFEIANKNLYSIMHKTANELNRLTENLEIRVEQRTKELQTLNDELQIRIDNAVKEVKQQSAIMNQQSKLASMGEILENIAHQWRQPLNSVSWILNDLKIKVELGREDEINLNDMIDKINDSIQFLSNTIDDFRRFVDKEDIPHSFNIKDTIESTIKLIGDTLKKSGIEIVLNCPKDIKYKGYENDIKHTIMNIINNARDAFEDRKVKDRKKKIIIRVYDKRDDIIITIQDNAGGIEKSVQKRIFEPYFTTKHKTKGTGLGLYMSKNMIDRVQGSIEVISAMNKKTTFIIRLPKDGAKESKKEIR